MRLLRETPGAVLWLLSGSSESDANLARAARSEGVDPGRMVFAPRMPHGAHLERHRHADLFLDTLPYGAHATGSDALWAGLPVLTCEGESLAGRVGSSLLRSIGLPELVTQTLDEYEALALALARQPKRLQAITQRLERNRNSEPLFDTERFARNLDQALEMMWRLHEAGEAPRSFDVTDIRA
jgi:predicted O-linked N-acetylglucosamine transferase (SPINDLY family)